MDNHGMEGAFPSGLTNFPNGFSDIKLEEQASSIPQREKLSYHQVSFNKIIFQPIYFTFHNFT